MSSKTPFQSKLFCNSKILCLKDALFGKCNIISWDPIPPHTWWWSSNSLNLVFPENFGCILFVFTPALKTVASATLLHKCWIFWNVVDVKIFLFCLKDLDLKGLGSPGTPWDEQRELSGTDLSEAVRGRVRDVVQNQGEDMPEKSLWNGNWIYSVIWN